MQTLAAIVHQDLAYISPLSRLYLASISPISPLHLPYTSPMSRLYLPYIVHQDFAKFVNESELTSWKAALGLINTYS